MLQKLVLHPGCVTLLWWLILSVSLNPRALLADATVQDRITVNVRLVKGKMHDKAWNLGLQVGVGLLAGHPTFKSYPFY